VCKNPICKIENCEILYGFCHCGCEKKTSIYRNYPRFFVLGHHKKKNNEYIVNPETGCWEWQLSKNKDGYGLKYYNGKMISAHIFYYEQKYGPSPPEKELDHFYCHNRGCCNPDHQEPVTHTENVRRGDSTKLNQEKVIFIRKQYSLGKYTHKQLANLFNVTEPTIFKVLKNISWR